MNSIKKCPLCGENLAEIIYGMPTPEIFEKAENKEYYLGGCVIIEDIEQPKYHCYNCNIGFNDDLTINNLDGESISKKDEIEFISHYNKRVRVTLKYGKTIEGFCETFTRTDDSEYNEPSITLKTKDGIIGVNYHEVLNVEDIND